MESTISKMKPKSSDDPYQLHHNLPGPHMALTSYWPTVHVRRACTKSHNLYSLPQTLFNPFTMSQTAKFTTSQATDAKEKGTSGSAATSSKKTKTGETTMGNYRMKLFSKENFQGKMMEVQNECTNICDCGMDRVRSIIVECGP
ncbi:beta-crystallin B1 [Electrophorus electricus]|uniref:beta-crystallin B1 n=1 Tax=Electrophorus electricus TaxID=8005 RepID=UPI0015D048B8|nr:beta-crystallin B1 [Electrophorus electricus]